MAHRAKSDWIRRGLIGAGLLTGIALIRRAARERRRRQEPLAGQVALVTGATRGLGFLVAEELARQGCRLVICARDADELSRAHAALSHHGSTEVLAVRCDVSAVGDVDSLVATALDRFGTIDLLVNNAGIVEVGPFETFGLDDYRRSLATTFWGTVNTTLAVVPHMKRLGTGRVVNVASIGGKVAVPHLLPYDCAKFAVVGFSEGLRAELARDGVSVTTVVPGLMRTGGEAFADIRTLGDGAWFRAAARLPGLSMSAERAARQIVAAAWDRRGEVVLGLPARVLRLAHDLFPETTLGLLAATNRVLPVADAHSS